MKAKFPCLRREQQETRLQREQRERQESEPQAVTRAEDAPRSEAQQQKPRELLEQQQKVTRVKRARMPPMPRPLKLKELAQERRQMPWANQPSRRAQPRTRPCGEARHFPRPRPERRCFPTRRHRPARLPSLTQA